MGEISGAATAPGASDGAEGQAFVADEPLTQSLLPGPPSPQIRLPTEIAQPLPIEIAQPLPTEVAQPHIATDALPTRFPNEVVRYGPGVPVATPPGTPVVPPAGQAGWTAGQLSRTGRPPAALPRARRWRRRSSTAVTIVLLAASGVLLFLRLHHAPLHVTGVELSQRAGSGCQVEVSGRIATNGSAGTVSYQWTFQPGQQISQPLQQSVTAGQHAVLVTVAVEGSGHGSASQQVTLKVLSPDQLSAAAPVTISC
jgi:hypothetical protein